MNRKSFLVRMYLIAGLIFLAGLLSGLLISAIREGK